MAVSFLCWRRVFKASRVTVVKAVANNRTSGALAVAPSGNVTCFAD